MRTAIARLIAPVMAATGYRFSKSFRRGDTAAHRIVYLLVDTVAANCAAYAIRPTAAEIEDDLQMAAMFAGQL